METPQEAVLRMMPSQPPCNQVSSALLCKCGFSCDCWTTCRLPLTGFASKCEFLCDRWITMPIDSIEPCLTALSLACCPGGFRNGRGTFYDASPAIEQAYAARCAICCPGHAALLWGLLVTLDKRSADGNSTAYFWWVLSLSVLMEENSHSI